MIRILSWLDPFEVSRVEESFPSSVSDAYFGRLETFDFVPGRDSPEIMARIAKRSPGLREIYAKEMITGPKNGYDYDQVVIEVKKVQTLRLRGPVVAHGLVTCSSKALVALDLNNNPRGAALFFYSLTGFKPITFPCLRDLRIAQFCRTAGTKACANSIGRACPRLRALDLGNALSPSACAQILSLCPHLCALDIHDVSADPRTLCRDPSRLDSVKCLSLSLQTPDLSHLFAHVRRLQLEVPLDMTTDQLLRIIERGKHLFLYVGKPWYSPREIDLVLRKAREHRLEHIVLQYVYDKRYVQQRYLRCSDNDDDGGFFIERGREQTKHAENVFASFPCRIDADSSDDELRKMFAPPCLPASSSSSTLFFSSD